MPEKYLYNGKVLERKDVEDAAGQSKLDVDTYIQKAGIKVVADNYSFNGKLVSAKDVNDAATQSNLGFDDYIKKAGLSPVDGGKKKDTPTTSATTAQNSFDPLANQRKIFSGLSKAPVGTNTPSAPPLESPDVVENPNTSPRIKKEKAQGSSLILGNGVELPVTSTVPGLPFQDTKPIKALQEKIDSGNLSMFDIDAISKITGKSPKAVTAYLKGDGTTGHAVETIDILQKNSEQLTGIINQYNADFGDKKNPTEILSSGEQTSKFLNEYLINLVKSDPIKERARQMDERGYAVDMEALANQVQSDPVLKAQVEKYQSLLGNSGRIVNELSKHIVKSTASEDYANAVPRDVTANKIAARIDPLGYANAQKALKEQTGFDRISDKSNVFDIIGAITDEVRGDKNFKDQMLNSVVGLADLQLNNAYAEMANEKAAMAKLTNDDDLLTQARLMYSHIDKKLLDKYPALQMQQMAGELGDEIARDAGQLVGTDTEDYALKIKGTTTEDLLKRMQAKGWFNDPAKKPLAMRLLENPEMIKDASYLGGAKDSFLQPFKDLGLSLMDLTGIRNFKDIYSDKVQDDLFPKEFAPDETKSSFTILGHDFKARHIVNGVSNLAGLVVGNIITEGALSESGLSAGAVKRISAYATFGIPSIDSNLKDSYNFIQDDGERAAFVTLGALINGEGGALLDLGKVSRVPGLAEDFKLLSKNLIEKNLTKDAVDELLNKSSKKYVDYVTKYGKIGGDITKETLKGAATMAYFTFGNEYNKLLNGDPNTKAEDLLPHAANAFMEGVFTMIPFGFVSGVKNANTNKNSSYKEMINKIATFPDAAQDVFRLGSKSQKDYEYKMQTLNTARAAKNSLDAAELDTGITLTPGQRSVYVANKTIEATLRDKAAKTENPELQEQYIRDADELSHQSVQTMDGLKFSPTLEPLYDLYDAEKKYNHEYEQFHAGNVKEDTALLEAKDNYERLAYKYFTENKNPPSEQVIINGNVTSKGHLMEILAKGKQEVDKYDIEYTGTNDELHNQLQAFGGITDKDLTISPKSREVVNSEGAAELYDRLEGKIGGHYLDPINKEGSINELTSQALTTPGSIHSALGYNDKLTLELISRNTTEDINKSIDKWSDSIKGETTSPSDIQAADRHIRLLEKALEYKAKIHEEADTSTRRIKDEDAIPALDKVKGFIAAKNQDVLPEDFSDRVEQVSSTQEAEKRWSDGERIFSLSEQDGELSEVKSLEQLNNNTPDQLFAYPNTHNFAHIDSVVDRISKSEPVNEKELNQAQDVLYDALEKHPEGANLIEPLILKLQDYENATETKTVTVTEEVPVEGADGIKRKRKAIKPALEQSAGSSVTVTLPDGGVRRGTLDIKSGEYVVDIAGGRQVVLGEKAITDRDLKLPSEERLADPIEFDSDGNVSSITFETRNGNLVKVEDPERALDLAIQLQAQEIGEIPDSAFEKAFTEVQKQVALEVPKKEVSLPGKTEDNGQPEGTEKTGGTGEVKVNSEAVPYNGRDVIGDRTRPQSEKDAGKQQAKEKIKDPSTNASLKAANSYNESAGLPPVTPHKYKPSEKELQSQIAELYPKLQDVNSPDYKETDLERGIYEGYKEKYPEIISEYDITDYQDLVKKSYAQLALEVQKQFDALPVKVSFHEGDKNYDSSAEMLDDVHNYNHIWVYRGGEDHTEIGSKTVDENGLTANDKFRAVHDYFGHSVEGYQFGKDGEENAWIEHSKMFSPLAQIALSSETRGQNSFVNYSGINEVPLEKIKLGSTLKKEGLKRGNDEMIAEGQRLIDEANGEFYYAEQKAIALPAEYTDISKYHESVIKNVPPELINKEFVEDNSIASTPTATVGKNPTTKELDSLANNVPDSGRITEYMSKDTIEKYTGETPTNDQSRGIQELEIALTHGELIIDTAKKIFGKDYVDKTLNYIDNSTAGISNKALMYVSLENALGKEKLLDPTRRADITKQQALVYAKSQAFARENSLALNYQKLRKVAQVGYDISRVTDTFFSAEELSGRNEVSKAIEASPEKINEEAQKQETAGMTPDIEAKIKEGVEAEINKIYEKLPKEKRTAADKAIAALENVQKQLRSKAYDATIGVPVAIIDAGISTIKLAIKAGVKIADAIELGIQKIKEAYGKAWDKEDEFRKDVSAAFGEDFQSKKFVRDALIKQGFGREVNSRIKVTNKDFEALESRDDVPGALMSNVKDGDEVVMHIGDKKITAKWDKESGKIVDKNGEVFEVADVLKDKDNYIQTDSYEKKKILDWKKLAGDAGTVSKISENVAEVLKDSKLTDKEIESAKDGLVDEYINLRTSVIENSLTELKRRNKETLTPEQKSAAKKLAELYTYGLFKDEEIKFDNTLNKALGVRVSEKGYNDAKKIAEAMQTIYSSSFKGSKLTDVTAKAAIHKLEDQLRILLFNEAKQHGNFALRAASLVRGYFDIQQTMILNNMKQAVENTLSGLQQNLIDKIEVNVGGTSTGELANQRRKLMKDVYKDMVVNGAVGYGKVESTFVNRTHIDDYVNKLSDNQLYHSIASVVTGKATLNAMDAMWKAGITEKKFTSNLIKILTHETNPNRMSKGDALKFVSEKLTGQTYKDAQETSKNVIEKINKDAGEELIPTTKESVDRLANDIVKAALEMGGKVTADQISAAYNAAYKSAGLGLGHEPNNILSSTVTGYTQKLEGKINQALKDKEWNRAAMLTGQSIIFRNILNPFVGGGTNWLILKLEKTGLGLFTGLGYKLASNTKIDLGTELGMQKLEQRLYNQARIKDNYMRGLVGGMASALTYLAFFGAANTDDYRKWRGGNMWAARYLDIITPEYLLAEMAVKNKKIKKYAATSFNRNDAFDATNKVIKAADFAITGKKQEAWGALGEAVGSKINAPVPWRLVKDGQVLYQGIKGQDPYHGDYTPSKGFVNGVFQGGVIEWLGLRPAPKTK